jgi:hypothetical protein
MRSTLIRLASTMPKAQPGRRQLLAFLADKTAKDLPKDVERYVQEGKDKGMDEDKAWAIAWSRYCKYKNPGSDHCKKDEGEYFKGKSASEATPEEVATAEKLLKKLALDFAKMVGGKVEGFVPFKEGQEGYFNGEIEVTLPLFPSTSSQPPNMGFSAYVGEGFLQVRPILYSVPKGWQGTARSLGSIAQSLGQFPSEVSGWLSDMLDRLRPGIAQEEARRRAEPAYKAAFPAMEKVVKDALTPLGASDFIIYKPKASIQSWQKNVQLGQPIPFGDVGIIVDGLVGQRGSPEFEADPKGRAAYATARKALARALKRFRVGEVRAKLSSKPGNWSGGKLDMHIFMYVEGMEPKKLATDARSPLTERARKSRQDGSAAFGVQGADMNRTARKLHKRQEKVLQKYLDSAGPRAASDYDDLPESVRSELEGIKSTETLWSDVNRWLGDNNNPHLRWGSTMNRTAADKNLRKSLIRLASTMPKGSRERQDLLHVLASEPAPRVASSPMSKEINRRSVAEGNAFMTYRIDANASAKGASKFYEGFITEDDGGYVYVRKYGALTDNAQGKNIKTLSKWYADLGSAQRALAAERKKRVNKRQYIDTFGPDHKHPATGKKLRQGQYPLGLYRPGLGFGHGTESAASCAPALRDLAEAVKAAIESIRDGDTVAEIQGDLTSALATLDRGAVDDRTMAAKMQKRLQLAVRRLTGAGRFLPDPEQGRLRKDLVWIKNYVESQTAYCQ